MLEKAIPQRMAFQFGSLANARQGGSKVSRFSRLPETRECDYRHLPIGKPVCLRSERGDMLEKEEWFLMA